jgi:predicted kinase
MFIIFAGLPGTGKSTIAQELARRLDAVYLRIDTIEQAIRSAGILASGAEVGPAGYVAAYRIAADNLRLGNTVIADSVNPLKITRDAFKKVAIEAGVGFVEVEVVCSDSELHRDRVRTRQTDVEGLVPPTWEEIQNHQYEAWDRPRLMLDTASSSIAQSVEEIAVCAKDRRLS